MSMVGKEYIMSLFEYNQATLDWIKAAQESRTEKDYFKLLDI